MHFLILTLFPEMFAGPFAESIVKRATEQKLVDIQLKNIRDFGRGKYKQVDDMPYGGGAGMVLRVDVLAKVLRWAKDELPEAKIISLSPQGERLTQQKCQELAEDGHPLILLCGHFEGIDERVREMFVDEEISLGDFVLTGGEIPAMALVDGVTRLLPGVLGNEESAGEESFSPALGGALEYPHYTRPETFEGQEVPAVLLSGNHAAIAEWRQQNLRGLDEEEMQIWEILQKYFSAKKPWKGERILLRQVLTEDQEYWLQWFNDAEVSRYLPFDLPYAAQDAAAFFQEQSTDFQGLHLTILERTTRLPIGTLSLQKKEESAHVALLGLVLGAKELWGQGYGTAVLREALKLGFTLLELEKITVEVFQENVTARRLYERAGFRLVGEAQKEVRKADGFHDLFLLELLKSEWETERAPAETSERFWDLRGDFSV